MRDDGYLGDEHVSLHGPGPRPRPAPQRRPQVPTAPGVVVGIASNIRQRTEPYGQNMVWQIVTLEIDRRDGGGRVAVELRGFTLKGPVPADGSMVRAHGRPGRDGVFRADRIVNAHTGHALNGGFRRTAKAATWVLGVLVVVFLIVVFTFVIRGFLTFGG